MSYCNVAVIVMLGRIVMLMSLQPYSIGSMVHYCVNIIQVSILYTCISRMLLLEFSLSPRTIF